MHDPNNPYASPNEPEQPASHADGGSDVEFVIASHSDRVLNLIVDTFVQMGLLAAMLVYGSTVAGVEAAEHFFESTLAELLLQIGLFMSYYILLEALVGKTIGKMVTRTKVVNENGGRPTFRQVFWRAWVRAIPLEVLSHLGTPCRGWHDRLTGTYVVKD